MVRSGILIFLFLLIRELICSGQVNIRLCAGRSSESVSFTVTEGIYELNTFNGDPVILERGALILISRSGSRIIVKSLNARGYICDSVLLKSASIRDKFSIRINGQDPVRRHYSGDLKCIPDLGTMVMINICDPETYIAGVVRAEGGEKKNIEYFKSQAVIARTYLYRNINKHITDGYDLCDNTHCQAYNGITSDSLIIFAALETSGMVILGPDSTLINSAFHSNCGGETAASEDVWLTDQSYLKSVKDQYCETSRNAKWQKILSKKDWVSFLVNSGYKGNIGDPLLLNFSQQKRMKGLSVGNFSVPLRQVRDELNLRSSFFSVTAQGDSVIINGRGYGHGVGLCQEGAMVMASKGFDFKQIINFYYNGVRIADIKDAVVKETITSK
jgi:stage II sporulation protein D